MILTLSLFSALYPTLQIKTKFWSYLCLKNRFCTLLLEVLWLWLFRDYCSFKGLQWGPNFINVNPHWSNYSAFLLTTANIFQRYCPRRGKVLYFQFMCVFLHSCQHSGKIIGVVDNNPEKCSNMNISTNLKPYANLIGLHSGAQADVFHEESWDERFCGTVPLINLFYFTFLRIILLQRHVHCTVRKPITNFSILYISIITLFKKKKTLSVELHFSIFRH
jgi:hypothetical protein